MSSGPGQRDGLDRAEQGMRMCTTSNADDALYDFLAPLTLQQG